jgi:prevent-host-death family protein
MNINLKEDLVPVSEFRSNAAAVIERVQREGGPLVITHHGKGAAVLMSLEEYGRMDEVREIREALARGRRDIARGNYITQEEMEKRHEKWLKRVKSSSAGRKRRS